MWFVGVGFMWVVRLGLVVGDVGSSSDPFVHALIASIYASGTVSID